MDNRIVKYFLGELDLPERLELIEQLETDATLKKEFIRMQNVHAFTLLSSQGTDSEEGRKGLERFFWILRNRKRKSIFRNILRYAAIAFILIASSVLGTRYFAIGPHEPAMNTLHVPAGQRAQITLQDGTEVWLNAQSTLTYPAHFSRRNRKVEINGEAFFDVAKDKTRPFIVSTQHIDMKVLGTQFNVYSYRGAGYIQTALVEGSVEIYTVGDRQNSLVLKPNEQVTVRGDKMAVTTISNAEHLLWKEGIYCFQNEQLIDIIDKLQLYYDVKIVVKDPDIFHIRYTGKFRQRDGIDEILRILRKIHRFNIKKDEDKNIITLTK